MLEYNSLEKIKNRFPVLSSFFFIFLLYFLTYVLYEFSRIGGLPKHSKAGLYNDISFSFALFGFFTFSFVLKRVGRYVFLLLLIFIVLMTMSNWWYFSFYKDFISLESMKLLLYFKESIRNISGLPHQGLSVLFSLIVLFLSYFILKLEILRPSDKWLSISSLLFLMISGVYFNKFYKLELGGGIHSGIHPIGFLAYANYLKESNEEININKNHIKSLKNLYPDRGIGVLSEKYPLMNSKNFLEKAPAKNVLIIVMESVRAAEMGAYGSKVTVSPNLDMISNDKNSVVFKNAYANSFQTPRGELAILCSAFDYVRGSPFSESNNRYLTKCLPNILKENGYSTSWFHGYEKRFFNRRNFLPSIGIDKIHDRDIFKSKGFDKELGWGIPDVDLFEYALQELEEQKKPFFSEILTLSNHFPYQWDWGIEFPEELRLNEDNKDDAHHAYKRGMYYTDHAIGKFWKKFKKSSLFEDTIVVFTSDHGIWLFNEDAIEKDESFVDFYKKDKYFRIPLIIHTPGIHSTAVNEMVSQVDIAPTILEMLKIDSVNAFVGRNILKDNDLASNAWVLSIGNGGVSFRQDNIHCHPNINHTDNACNQEKAYQSCDIKNNERHSFKCSKVDGNFLSDNKPSVIPVDTPKKLLDINLMMEYLTYSLKNGLMPKENL